MKKKKKVVAKKQVQTKTPTKVPQKQVYNSRSTTSRQMYKPTQQMYQPQEPKKKVKIRYGRILITIVIVTLLYLFLSYCYKSPIKTIIIKNNTFLTDQEIIDLAGIRDYPSNIQNSCSKIKKALEKNTYIKSVTVKKNLTGEVTIEVEENYPLFFYQPNNKTVLKDGKEVTSTFDVPLVINYIPNTKYEQFFKVMQEVDKNVLIRISEIKYDPNEVDEGRFLLTMSDGNYVYVTLTRFSLINHYVDIISKEEFSKKKGIIRLDAGNSFEVLEG